MLRESVRDFLGRVFRWEDPGVALARTVLGEGALYVLNIFAGFAPSGSVWFWLALGVVIFLTLGVVEAMRFPRAIMEPDIEGDLLTLTPVNMPSGPTWLVAGVSIANQGADSALDGWFAEARSPDGEWHRLANAVISNLDTTIRHGNVALDLTPNKLLNNQTTATVETGGLRRGLLVFVVTDQVRRLLNDPNTEIRIQCTDVRTGGQHTFSSTWREARQSLPYLPEMNLYRIDTNQSEEEDGTGATQP